MQQRRCWAEIDIGAIVHNLRVAKESAGTPGIMAVVKADAYGHGLPEVAEALAPHATMFGVANVAEANLLRQHVPDHDVLLLGPCTPGEREAAVRGGFLPSISGFAEAEAYDKLAGAAGKLLRVHAVIDTGMGRIGIWQEEAVEELVKIRALRNLRIEGIATHLPVADEDEAWTQRQLAGFRQLLQQISSTGWQPKWVHASNSAGVLGYNNEPFTLARPGLMLYGSSPLPALQQRLKPAMTLKTQVTLVRDVGPGRGISYGRTFITPHAMRVATLGAGYGDGYRRHLTASGAEVLIRGSRCSLLGRVTMDQIMVDVSHLQGIEAGEEAVLMGRQGSEEITAAGLAAKSGTIPWEIFTGIAKRVERVYL